MIRITEYTKYLNFLTFIVNRHYTTKISREIYSDPRIYLARARLQSGDISLVRCMYFKKNSFSQFIVSIITTTGDIAQYNKHFIYHRLKIPSSNGIMKYVMLCK